MEGADLRTIGGVRGGVSLSKTLDLVVLTMKMFPCDGSLYYAGLGSCLHTTLLTHLYTYKG
jgi:hypothetical protein